MARPTKWLVLGCGATILLRYTVTAEGSMSLGSSVERDSDQWKGLLSWDE